MRASKPNPTAGTAGLSPSYSSRTLRKQIAIPVPSSLRQESRLMQDFATQGGGLGLVRKAREVEGDSVMVSPYGKRRGKGKVGLESEESGEEEREREGSRMCEFSSLRVVRQGLMSDSDDTGEGTQQETNGVARSTGPSRPDHLPGTSIQTDPETPSCRILTISKEPAVSSNRPSKDIIPSCKDNNDDSETHFCCWIETGFTVQCYG